MPWQGWPLFSKESELSGMLIGNNLSSGEAILNTTSLLEWTLSDILII